MEIEKNASYLAKIYINVVRNKGIKSKITGKRAVSLIKKLVDEKGRDPDDLEAIFLSLQPGETFELPLLLNDNYYNQKLERAKSKIIPRGLSGIELTDYQSQLKYFVDNILKINYDRIMNYEKTYFDVVLSASKVFFNELYMKLWLFVDIPVNLIFRCKIANPKDYISPELEKELRAWNKKTSYKRKVLSAYIQLVKTNKWLKELVCRELNNIEEMVKEMYDGDDFKKEKYLKEIEEQRRLIC